MKLLLPVFSVLIFSVLTATSQTNPTPLMLPVSENFGTATFTSPKPGMASWTGDGARPYTTQTAAEVTGGGANVTLVGADPVSGNSGGQYGHAPAGNGRLTILLSSNSTNGTTQTVMALNTTGATTVSVSYNLVLSVPNTRDVGLALQYRLGTAGNFTTVATSSVIYNSTTSNGGDADGPNDFDTYTFTLPAEAADEPVVQLRWITWRPATGTGNSSGIGIDNINITSGVASPCTEPTAQPTALVLTPSPISIAGSFTGASPAADRYLVIRSTSSSLSSQPVDGNTYSAGQALGSGTVISANNTTAFTATGLTPSTQYYFFVYAFNADGCSGGPNYGTASPLTGNSTTPALAGCVAPAAAPTALSLSATNTNVSGSFTASATANRYLVVRSTTSTLSSNPMNGTTYTAGQSLGGGVVVAYNNVTSFSATGLTANTLYYIFVFAANAECTGEPFYSVTALTGNTSTTNTTTNLPPTYYNAANGLSCAPLKTALATIITNGATVLTYTPGVWQAYLKTDIKRNFENTRDIIWDMYSNKGEGLNEPYEFVYQTNQCGNYSGEGDCYNREHSFPQSWFVGGTLPMFTDLNHLFPTDGWVNNLRGNFPFGEVTTVENTPGNPTLNGSKRGTGNNFGYTATVFEPINEYKGDFARAQFYMATRYESQIAGWQNNGNANEVLNGTAYQAFDDWYVKLLYKWHVQDPVSAKEIARNDSVFVVQGNRNPFIDKPEYVLQIWSCTGVISGVNDIINVSPKAVVVYPNPVVNKTATLKLEKAFTQAVTLQVIDFSGRIIQQQVLAPGQTVINFHTNSFAAGVYSVKINTAKGIITKTFVVH